ncbi:MAG: ParB/RepB/Spo0J family partition protein, partial [Acetobacteraceae bacterium]|nr:ParB/RepB/Spo0J family partition protein [Acetobacteraceae bacterium]
MTRPPAKGATRSPASKTAPEPPKAPAPPRPKAQIGAAAFGALRAAIGEDTRGEAMRIPLADIDEDPNQPRRLFDEGELESLAESIRERGVLQPVVVRHGLGGRWTLVMGARRLRASRLAGAADIPAVIQRGGDGDDYAAQVIENQQRRDLSNSELAAAVGRFAAEGRTTKQIGTICNLKDYQVAAFRKADEFPPELRARMDEGDMRALYDLYRQWTKTPAEVVAALPEPGTFVTVTEARRIVGAITGKPTGSIVLERAAPSPAEPPAPAAPESGGKQADAGGGPPPAGDAPP